MNKKKMKTIVWMYGEDKYLVPVHVSVCAYKPFCVHFQCKKYIHLVFRTDISVENLAIITFD